MCLLRHFFLPMYAGTIIRVTLICNCRRNIILRIYMKYLYMVSILEFRVRFQDVECVALFFYEPNREVSSIIRKFFPPSSIR